MSNVRDETSGVYRWEYLKGEIDILQTKSTNKNIRDMHSGVNEFKKDYQPRTNLTKGRERWSACKYVQYFE